jgi:hypothetical protein
LQTTNEEKQSSTGFFALLCLLSASHIFVFGPLRLHKQQLYQSSTLLIYRELHNIQHIDTQSFVAIALLLRLFNLSEQSTLLELPWF